MSNANLETFVNSIRNLYQKENASGVNYIEILNAINSHSDLINENFSNLLDNVLPIFNLPDYTLPHMSVLYAIVLQVNNTNSATGGNAVAPAANTNIAGINLDRLFNDVENCINSADYRQVTIKILSELNQ